MKSTTEVKKDYDIVEFGKRLKWLVDSGELEINIKIWIRCSVDLDMVSAEDANALCRIFFERV